MKNEKINYIFKRKDEKQFPFVVEITSKKFCSNIDDAKRFTFDEAVKYHLDNPNFEIIQETSIYERINFEIETKVLDEKH